MKQYERDPIADLTPEEVQERLDNIDNRLKEIELRDILNGDYLPDDLPPPDTYGTLDS